jgi:hypothetical protein
MRSLAILVVLNCVASPSLYAQVVPMGLRPRAVVSEHAVQPRRSRAREGAVVGFIVGATVTVVVTRSGGSTAPCNRSANQDALSSGECLGLAVAGGVVGAGLGALIGSRMRMEVRENTSLLPRHRGGLPNRGFLLVVSIGAPFGF